MPEPAGDDARMITFEEAAKRGDFIQLERRPPADDGDPLAGFDPDEALDEIRELTRGFGTRLAYLVDKLDHWLLVGERLPREWAHPEPAVIAVRAMRKQPRRTSRQERHHG